MIDTRFSKAEKELLKAVCGKKLIYIKSTEADNWKRIYGNAVLTAENCELEIRNEIEPVSYFETVEDISVYHINEINDNYKYIPGILDADVIAVTVNSIINEIIIVEDEIIVSDSSGELIYNIIFDTAIVIKTDSGTFTFSREWYFEEDIIFKEGDNYKDNIYPVENIIEDWTDEEYEYNVKCIRQEKILR